VGAEDAFDGAEADAVLVGEFVLSKTSGVVGVGEVVALVGSEAVGGGLGAVRGAEYEAFDRSDADAVFGGERFLSDAGVEGGDQLRAFGGGEALSEFPRRRWRADLVPDSPHSRLLLANA
jgi:hypothetical protein